MASSDKNGIRLADLGLAGIAAVFVGHSARREMTGGKPRMTPQRAVPAFRRMTSSASRS
jgi:hypothetical protein